VGEYRRASQISAGGIDDGDFTAGAVAGVDAHYRCTAQRRLEKQRPQIRGKDTDRLPIGVSRQVAPDVTLDRWPQQASIAIFDGCLEMDGQHAGGIRACRSDDGEPPLGTANEIRERFLLAV
jgi:hypothetical protein